MNRVIGAHHEFHDEDYVSDWADRFVPTKERRELFALMCSELKSHIPADAGIVELGIGPGYLAEHLLGLLPNIRYLGVDFSAPMLAIARTRLVQHASRVDYLQADLIRDNWSKGVKISVHAIVSTWALHDLGSREAVAAVYGYCAAVLQNGGLLLNGDFIKPDTARHEYECGRFEIATHVRLLRCAGFTNVGCLGVLETEIESPTAAQNYACFKGVIERPA